MKKSIKDRKAEKSRGLFHAGSFFLKKSLLSFSKHMYFIHVLLGLQ